MDKYIRYYYYLFCQYDYMFYKLFGKCNNIKEKIKVNVLNEFLIIQL